MRLVLWLAAVIACFSSLGCTTSAGFKPDYSVASPQVDTQNRIERYSRPGDLTPGTRFQDCNVCPPMIVVSAGPFIMGSSPEEEGHFTEEEPQHRVNIGQAFAVGVSEVTYEEFANFVGDTKWQSTDDACGFWRGGWDGYWEYGDSMSWRTPGFPQTKRDPVVCVSWPDSQAYVDWLTETTGKSYRLLSEAEWEYVARGGMTTRYHWGDEAAKNRANCGQCGNQWDDRGTAPVSEFSPNAFGLYGTAGNVWEWTSDCWSTNYMGAPNDGSTRTTGDCSKHVIRGGSWASDIRYIRSAQRNWSRASVNQLGFRVASQL